MTIPQLRAAFEHLDQKAMEVKGKDTETQIKEFQSAWKKVFSREVSPKAVEAYLSVKHSEPTKRRTTRKAGRRRGQIGGSAALAGAPLDYQLRSGTDGVHGSFPDYVDKGLTFYNDINQHARLADCGKETQAGGASVSTAIADFTSALSFKPYESTSPPTVYQDIRSAYLGLPLSASPAVEDHTWKFK